MNKMIPMLLLLFLTNMGFGQVSDAFITQNTDFKITQKGPYAVVESSRNSSNTTKVGAPQLPVISRNYYLPAGSVVTGVQFNNGTSTLAGANLLLYPSQPACPLNGQPCPDFVAPDMAYYELNTPYPAKSGELANDASVFGYHMVTLNICPFQYYAKEKKLYYFEEIHLSIQYTIGDEEYQLRITERRHELTKDFVRSSVENPDLLSSSAKTANVIWDTDNQPHTQKLNIPWKPSPYGDVPDCIVITNEALKPSFDLFATYKSQKGIPTLVTTVEQIYQNYPGSDNAEKIRNYLKAAHHYWGAGLFILLGGDTAVIPPRIGTNDGILRNTDMYYCDVYKPGDPNYNWNSDGDSDYGWDNPIEIGGPDNFIGRAPVDTVAEAQTFVQKIISYESLSNVSNTAYVNNNLFIGPYFFSPPYCNGYHGQMWNNTTTTQPFWSNANNIEKWKMYDDFTPGVNNVFCNTYPGNEELTRPTTIERLNNGHPVNGLNFHIIGHVDHGSPWGIGVSSGMKGHSLYREDMDNLSNGANYQILYTGCCDAGEFDKDCFAEHFVNNPNGGGVAALANSGYGYTSSQNQEVQFFKSIYDTTVVNGYIMGMALQKSRLAYNSTAIINNLNLFGEPSMEIWTNTPQSITLTVPANVTINNTIENILPVTINALTEKATVTLYKFNTVTQSVEVYSKQYLLPGDTNAEFVLHPDTEGVMIVKVTAKNYLPATANVNILLPQAHLYVTGYSISDSNGNGLVEQGETVNLTISLTNSGNTDITGINTILSCNPAFANVTANQVSYAQINAGQTVQLNTYTFIAQLSNGTIEFPEFLEFYLNITADGNYSHLDNFYLDMKNPVLNLGARNMSNSAGPVTSFTLNENTSLNVFLSNAGNIATGPLTATLTSSLTATGIIVITEGSRTYPNIAMYATEHNTLPFEFHLAQPHSGAKPFTLTLTNSFGKTWTFNFDLNEPQPPLIANFHFTSTKDEIKLMWNAVPSIMGYNIYKSDTENGTYTKQNDLLVTGTASYTDTDVSNTTIYYYKISVVSSSGNERLLNQVVTNDPTPKQGYKAWTSLDTHAGFPAQPLGNNSNHSPATLYDVNNDGKKEIFLNLERWGDAAGKIMAFYESGQEMFNIDGNETTVSGFITTNIGMIPNAAVGDLDNDGDGEVLSIGRKNDTNEGRLYVYNTTDDNQDSNPDTFWPNQYLDVGYRVWRNPVLYDVDGNGFLDIIIVDENQKVYVYDNNQQLMPGWPIQIPGSDGWSEGQIAVADLDHDGKGEIAIGVEKTVGTKGGIYIWNHDGTDFGANPFALFTDGERADSGIVFADINNDLNLDLLITTKKATAGRIYAFKQDGTPVSSIWNGTVTFSVVSGDSHVIPRIAVGDMNHDGNLEIAFGSTNNLYLLNKDGGHVTGFPKASSDIGDSSPILADIDTDDDAEILFNNGGILSAYDYSGSECIGFPLDGHDSSGFSASPSVDDLDGDGKNEIVVPTGTGTLYAYKTDGNPVNNEWASYRANTHNTGTYREVCNGILDLYVKDSAEDTGEEPNTVTPYMWASNNIWIRNNDDDGLEHQNPEYGAPNYAKIRVINNSCTTSTGEESLTFYWAKASAYLSWPNPWNGGIQFPSTGASMGEESGTLNIPVLAPGEEVILTFPWAVPDPSQYGNDGEQWHFCLLARITGDTDPIAYPETWDLNANVRNNNNIAWKNVTVVDVLPNNTVEPGGVVAIGNSLDTAASYYLEMLVDDKEPGMPIYEAAEVTLEMDKWIHTVWKRGGEEVYKLEPTSKDNTKIIRTNRAKLLNLPFERDEMGTVKFNFHFLTKKVTEKTNFVFHVLQRDTRTHDIIGGETFYINKTDRSPFKADAGDDREVDWNQPLTINAEDINEPALYNWYDSTGKLIYEGKELQIAKAVAERYKLEVISTIDGYKDYTEVEVKLKPNRLESISPNPASSNIDVLYKLNEASSAYLMIVSYYITGGVSNNYVLDLTSSQTNINISNYPNGFYKVVLVVNGQVVDAKLLFKE